MICVNESFLPGIDVIWLQWYSVCQGERMSVVWVWVASVNYLCFSRDGDPGWQYVCPCVRVCLVLAWPGCCCLWLYTGKFRESLGWMRRGGGSGTGMAARHPEPVLMDLKLGDFATISRILQLISTILLPTVPTEISRNCETCIKWVNVLVKIVQIQVLFLETWLHIFGRFGGFSYWVNLLLKDSWISMRFSFV